MTHVPLLPNCLQACRDVRGGRRGGGEKGGGIEGRSKHNRTASRVLVQLKYMYSFCADLQSRNYSAKQCHRKELMSAGKQ